MLSTSGQGQEYVTLHMLYMGVDVGVGACCLGVGACCLGVGAVVLLASMHTGMNTFVY